MDTGRVLALLRLKMRREGLSYAEAARQIGVTPAYIFQVLTGYRPPSNAILNWLGLEKVTIYRRKR